MRCEEVRRLLQRATLEGIELRDSDRVGIHVASCPDCRAERDRHLLFASMLEGPAEEPPPSGLRTRIMERVQAEHRARQRTSPPVLQLVFACAMVALFGTAIFSGVASQVAPTFARVFMYAPRQVYESMASLPLAWGSTAAPLLALVLLVVLNLYFVFHALSVEEVKSDER